MSPDPAFRHATVASLLERRFAAGSDRTFLIWDDYEGGQRQWSYGEAGAEIRRAASRLHAVGESSSTVFLIGPTSPDLLFLWLGCLASGLPVAVINPTATSKELSRFIDALGPSVLVSDDESDGPEAKAHLGGGRQLSQLTMRHDEQFDAAGQDWPDYWRGADPDHRAGYIFTSGTTGSPKAVTLTQANYAWGGAVCSAYFRLQRDDRLAGLLPLYHVNAQVYSILSAITSSSSLVLAPRLSVSRFWPLVEAHRINKVSMSIFGMEVIAQNGNETTGRLELVASGTQRRHWQAGWSTEVVSMYGSSETVAPPILGTSTDGLPEGSIGSVTPFYAARVASAAGSSDGRLQGELQVFGIPGRSLALGYVMVDGTFANLPMTDDGWFRTGDVVESDSQGWIRFLGRADDVLKVRGENVSPAEIEQVIRGTAGVDDVAVVGRPDPVWGHIPVAVLQMSDDSSPTDDVVAEIIRRLEGGLTRLKHPQAILRTDRLPRSNLNKIQKSVVRDSLDSYVEIWRSERL